MNVSLRPLVPSDVEWVTMLRSPLPAEAWRSPAANGLWFASAVHLDEQPVGALALGRLDLRNGVAHAYATSEPSFDVALAPALGGLAGISCNEFDLRKIYFEWLAVRSPPEALVDQWSWEGCLRDYQFAEGSYRDVQVYSLWAEQIRT